MTLKLGNGDPQLSGAYTLSTFGVIRALSGEESVSTVGAVCEYEAFCFLLLRLTEKKKKQAATV